LDLPSGGGYSECMLAEVICWQPSSWVRDSLLSVALVDHGITPWLWGLFSPGPGGQGGVLREAFLGWCLFLLCLQICVHYNKGDGPFGSCSFQDKCNKLHICQYFLQGECKFGTSCKRSHDFSNTENLEKLERLGMSSDLVSRLPSIYRNAHDIKNKDSAHTKVPSPPVGTPGTSGKAGGKCCCLWMLVASE
jgi:hypothetical protein